MEKARYDVFLSHATPDKPAVEELARILKLRGLEPWLDKWNLIPGAPWQEAIEKALRECASCAVFLGPSGIGPWQNAEMRAAINRRVSDVGGAFRVIPVLLPGAKRSDDQLPDFLAAATWVELRDTLEDEQALHRLISGIRGVEPGPGPGEAVAEGECPYRGLQVFDIDHSHLFFGREEVVGILLKKLRTSGADTRFLAIVGRSGSGKSSLARAGLLASLKSGKIPGGDTWPVAICKPGQQPLESLAIALADAARLGDSPSAVLGLIRDLGTDTRMLHLTTRHSLRAALADQRFLILIDQFEEVFTLCPDETQRGAFIANLLQAAREPEGRTVVVLTLRADFYGRCDAYPDLRTAISEHQAFIGPMNRDELRSAIEGPALLTGCTLEGGLADLLLNEVAAEPGSLPLLEHALFQIWKRREGGRRLTIAGYHATGGVTGALEKHAEEVFAGFNDAEREACRKIFLCLVQVDEQERATKRRRGLDELPPAADRNTNEIALDLLTQARLLTADQEQRPTVELAHEALIRNWNRLKQWVEEDAENLRTRRRLEEAATEWTNNGRDPSFLYRGARLSKAEEWAASHPGEAKPEDFLKASIAQRDKEVNEERRRRRWKLILLAAATLTAVVVAGVMYGLWKKSIWQQQTNLATQMAGQAKLVLASNPLVSLMLGTKAVQLKDDLPEAKGALLGALARFDTQPLGKPGIVALAAAADRRSIVTISSDKVASLWALDGEIPAAPVQTLRIEESISRLALSSDRNWLLTLDRDGHARLRNLSPHGKVTEVLDENWPPGDPFSPDSKWLIMRKLDTPVLHDPSRGSYYELKGGPISLWPQAYSPDSRHLAVAPGGHTPEIWDLPWTASDFRHPLSEVPAIIFGLSFSPNGPWLAATLAHGSSADAVVWRVDPDGTAGQPIFFQGCGGNPQVVVCSNGRCVYTWRAAGAPYSSCLWRVDETGNVLSPTRLPNASIATFSAEGRWLAWGDNDGAVRLLNPLSSPASAIDLVDLDHEIMLLLFTQGDRWLVIQGRNEALRIVDMRRYPSGEILAATPDGARLIVAPPNGPARIVEHGNIVGRELLSSGSIGLIRALSPDGSWLATGGPNEKINLWNIAENPAPQQVGDSATALAIDPKTRFLAVGKKGEAWLRSFRNGALREVTADPDQTVTVFAFAPDQKFLAVGWDQGRIGIFPTDSEGVVAVPPQREAAVKALTFSPDSRWLAMADANGKVVLWSFEKNELSLEGQDKKIHILAFSRDGRQIASGGQDGTLQLWSFDGERSPGPPVAWKGHDSQILALSFTADGKELISTGSNDGVRRWPLRTEDLIRLACQKAGRSLTKEEWDSNAPPGEHFQEGTPCGSSLR